MHTPVLFVSGLFDHSVPIISGYFCILGWYNAPVFCFSFEAPLAARHPIHLPSPEETTASSLLISSALCLSKLLYELFLRNAAALGPRVFSHDTGVLANNDLYCTTIVHRALFTIQLS